MALWNNERLSLAEGPSNHTDAGVKILQRNHFSRTPMGQQSQSERAMGQGVMVKWVIDARWVILVVGQRLTDPSNNYIKTASEAHGILSPRSLTNIYKLHNIIIF